jgi:hypothetical protein
MAIVIIHGEVKLNDSKTKASIWEVVPVTYADGNTYERKTLWDIWFSAPVSFETGDWIEVKGQLSTGIKKTKNEDGSVTIGTWTSKDGAIFQKIEHIINEPTLLQVKAKAAPKEAALDLDDLAKYGNAPF